MSSLLGNRERGIKLLEEKVVELADAHAARLGLPVRVEPNFIVQAFDAALNSVRFHNIDLEKLSHKKEMAHVGFWIAELKPVTISPPRTPKVIMENAVLLVREFIEGARGAATPYDKEYAKARRKYLDAATFAISETIGLELIANFLQAEFKLKVEEITDPAYREVALRENLRFNAIFYDGGIFEHIVKALRFHIYTPRAFATLIEAVFAFEGPLVLPQDDE